MIDISPAFTIEDIRKIRESEDERQKGMSYSERVFDSAKRGREAEKALGLNLRHITKTH